MSGPESGGAPPPSAESSGGGDSVVAKESKPVTTAAENPLSASGSAEGSKIETGSENPLQNTESSDAPKTDTLSDGTDLGKMADDLASGKIDVDSEFQKFASESTDQADQNPIDAKQAKQDELMNKTPDELAKLAAEGDQDAADFLKGMNPNQTTEDASKPYDASAAGMRDRLNAARSMAPEDLQKAAAEGNVIAKQALRDQEKQVAAEAEDFVNQQDQSTQPAAETSSQNQTQTPENSSPTQSDTTEPVIEQPTDMTQETAAQDQGQDATVDGARFHEPTAEERANGQQVTPTSPEQSTPAQAAETTDTTAADSGTERNQQTEQPKQETDGTPEQKNENAEDTGEDKDKEKTPEQEAAELRLGRDQLVQKLLEANPNIDLSKPEVQNFLDLAGQNKENMDTMTEMAKQFMGPESKEAAEKLGISQETYAQGSVEGIINNIEQNLQKLKSELAKNPSKELQDKADKDNWFIILLKALLEVIKTGAVMAKAGFDSLRGKEKEKDDKK